MQWTALRAGIRINRSQRQLKHPNKISNGYEMILKTLAHNSNSYKRTNKNSKKEFWLGQLNNNCVKSHQSSPLKFPLIKHMP